jgi:hypothetical protein
MSSDGIPLVPIKAVRVVPLKWSYLIIILSITYAYIRTSIMQFEFSGLSNVRVWTVNSLTFWGYWCAWKDYNSSELSVYIRSVTCGVTFQ